ncbi:MAG TPA: hydroxyacylglutathione hydrolase [Thiomicrospira sp.]|jgi:hydroxyacylglutathione hydrolase|nr:hydroxyacylglutathione hydrolase [Thiomicrospira sp.]
MNIVGLPALVGTYDNYIWVIHNEKEAWVVDPGESEQIIEFLNNNQLVLKAILITHQHFDHVDGVEALKEHCPNCTVYGPEKSNHPTIQVKCKENDSVQLNERFSLKVLDTPGHTKDHIAYYNDEALFCGDTLFTAGCGRILGGSVEEFSSSILKLRQLPDTLGFYCAHEYTNTNLAFAKLAEPENIQLQQRIDKTDIHYPAIHQGPQSTLGEEKLTNPFLRFDTPALKAELIKRGASNSASSLFAELRSWKDQFDKSH